MRRHEPVIAQCTDSVVFLALVSTKEKMVKFWWERETRRWWKKTRTSAITV